jgi:hypothetical protein
LGISEDDKQIGCKYDLSSHNTFYCKDKINVHREEMVGRGWLNMNENVAYSKAVTSTNLRQIKQ